MFVVKGAFLYRCKSCYCQNLQKYRSGHNGTVLKTVVPYEEPQVRILPSAPYICVAQLAEHLTFNQGVGSSNLLADTINGRMSERLCSGLQSRLAWFDSKYDLQYASVAQWQSMRLLTAGLQVRALLEAPRRVPQWQLERAVNPLRSRFVSSSLTSPTNMGIQLSWESTCFASRRSSVRSRLSPPIILAQLSWESICLTRRRSAVQTCQRVPNIRLQSNGKNTWLRTTGSGFNSSQACQICEYSIMVVFQSSTLRAWVQSPLLAPYRLSSTVEQVSPKHKIGVQFLQPVPEVP